MGGYEMMSDDSVQKMMYDVGSNVDSGNCCCCAVDFIKSVTLSCLQKLKVKN